jgi:cytochrome b6-f complex iron-sulfur subunit
MTTYIDSSALGAIPQNRAVQTTEGYTRREILTYAWAAALGLLTLETTLASFAYLKPRFRLGEFGGKFTLGTASDLPANDAPPVSKPVGKFWLVNTDKGPKALYMVCTHLGCLYKWDTSLGHFKCPCHSSEYSREGHYISGPTSRSLDQFVVEIVENGKVVAATEQTTDGIIPPFVTNPNAEIIVNTGQRLLGQDRALSPLRQG